MIPDKAGIHSSSLKEINMNKRSDFTRSPSLNEINSEQKKHEI
jgi:hypothetical protein